MSLDVGGTLRTGLDRLQSRNGALLIGAFVVVSAVGNVALDSAALVLQELAEEVAVEAGEEPPEAISEEAIPLAFELSGSVILLLGLVWLLGWATLSIITVRVMATEHTTTIPDDLLSRRLAAATINELFARIVIWVLVGIGFLFLIVPGIFLAIAFYFARPLIAIEDRNAIDAMVESWRLSAGDRFTILALLAGAVAIYAAITIVGSLGSAVLSGFPVAAAIVAIVVGAVANVFWLAVMARAFVQLREPDEDEPAEPDAEQWNDPDGVEW